MVIGRLRNALPSFPQMKGPFIKFSTHSHIVHCQKLTDLVLQKLQKKEYLCDCVDMSYLSDCLKEKIGPAVSDHSGFPLTHEIELSKDLFKARKVPCKIIIPHTTIRTLINEGRVNEEGVKITT